MTDFLLATSSIHVSASAADFLADRATAEDTVWVLAVLEERTDPRDGEDALNVAAVRLGTSTSVETETREGDPTEEIRAAAGEHAVDVIVIGPWRGEPGTAGTLGETARAVIEGADRPVVVVPLSGSV